MELRVEDVSLCLDHCRKSPPPPQLPLPAGPECGRGKEAKLSITGSNPGPRDSVNILHFTGARLAWDIATLHTAECHKVNAVP